MKTLANVRSAKGFTLLEVMVALLIIGLALPALMGRMGSMASTVDYTRDLTIAHWVAENVVQEVYLGRRLQNVIPKGRQSGEMEMAGVLWDWKTETEEQKDLYEGSSRVRVQVFREGQDEALVELSMVLVER